MGRASNPESYEEILEGLRRRAPDAALGADIIVGFPGETDEEFERTRGFLERSPLTYLHVFPFSPREGTPAAAMEPVDEAVKAARADILRDLSRAKDLAFRAGFVGRELEAVVIADGAGPIPARACGTSVITAPAVIQNISKRETLISTQNPGTTIPIPRGGGPDRQQHKRDRPGLRRPAPGLVTVRITEATADNTLGICREGSSLKFQLLN